MLAPEGQLPPLKGSRCPRRAVFAPEGQALPLRLRYRLRRALSSSGRCCWIHVFALPRFRNRRSR